MNNFKIYLSGATKNVSPTEDKGWRKAAEKLFDYYGDQITSKLNIINPNDYFTYDESTYLTQKQVMDFELWQAKTSDLVLVNLNKSNTSIGTGMEVQCAIDNGVPIIGFGSEEVYPWIEEHCSVVFDNVANAVRYIIDYYID